MISANLRVGVAAATIVVSLGASYGLVASGVVRLDASPAVQNVIHTNAEADQETLVLEIAPGPGDPPIEEAQAVAVAKAHLPTTAQPTGILSRYVDLTLRDTDGQVAWGLQSHPAWLITFKGVGYVPFGHGASACSCTAAFERPNTLAALDARTGAFISYFGVEN